MALLCHVEMAAKEIALEYCGDGRLMAELMEREDSQLPLLSGLSLREDSQQPPPPSPPASTSDPLTSTSDPFGPEHREAVSGAVVLLDGQLKLLRRKARLSRTETSDLLRDTCQDLGELTTRLENIYRKAHPGEPLPPWPVNAIPEEELARIGWDFYANRVQMKTGGSLWDSLATLFNGDQGAGFAEPPSADAVAEALSRSAGRLSQLAAYSPESPAASGFTASRLGGT